MADKNAIIPPRGLLHRFYEEMGALFGIFPPSTIAVAVSGGGDSMALLHLARYWGRESSVGIRAVTVNHHLRPEAEAEVALVAAACEELYCSHTVLDWHWDGTGNLQDEARKGRLNAIGTWLDGNRGTKNLLMAHTLDDQAETFLMRLARGSGVDGLSAMAPRVAVPGYELDILRPLLGETRDELRHYLKVMKIDYADDPSNDDPTFERVRMRQALPALAELGLTKEKLAATATRMGRAREALGERALEAHNACLVGGDGSMLFDVVYDRDLFAKLSKDIQLRLLAAALQYVGEELYRPRLSSLEDVLDRALAGGASTLHGAFVYPHRDFLYIVAEYERIKDEPKKRGRWRNTYWTGTLEVRPLGEAGAAQLRNNTRLPARVLWPCPAVWDGDTVLATPRLGANEHWNPAPEHWRFRRLLTSR
ncbi:MAG: tRNA lysidine(34) synthetase TilS [Pseudomonadota bacterium]